jgi:chloride channel 3/4/5
VLFQVRYVTDWKFFEMAAFIILGILGGAMGALFIKAARIWATTFRRISIFKTYPILEVTLIALVTGIVSFWNRYTKLPVTELLFELASPCDAFTSSGTGLCPTQEQIPTVIWYLCIAFVIKAALTTITFGIKVPAGIYVPSMVCGGILGRIVGHIVQYLALNYSHTGLFGTCSPTDAPESCVVPGVYAMVAAGATMCGVTRLSVTLAVILFELTGSLDHVLPFSIGVLAAKWTADAMEPLSIYDLLTDMNSYPFLDNKVRPIFTTELGDIVPRHVRSERVIDISSSPLVPAHQMRQQLEYLQMAGELDGGLPIVKDGVLVGLLPAPDLEFALDKLENEDKSLCLMSPQAHWDEPDISEGADADMQVPVRPSEEDPTDFTPYIDPAPVSLDVHSPMDLVYECFVKLGLRYICVLRDGQYAGLVSVAPSMKLMTS